MTHCERIGRAIERAAEELPDGYDISIDLDRGSACVTLFIPPLGDDGGGSAVDKWSGCDFCDNLNEAVDMAIEHNMKALRDGGGT